MSAWGWAGVLAAAAVAVAWPGATGPTPSGAGPAASAHRWRSPWTVAVQRRQSAAYRVEVLELLAALVAELHAGAAPRAALVAGCAGLPSLGALAAAARSPAGDVPLLLNDLGSRPGAGALRDLAVAWQVAERSGCGLAGPVARLRAAARDGERVREEVAAQLAGPRATARLLSGLPLIGVALGTGLGADPIGFLTSTGPGAVCLGIGLALLVAGERWTAAILRSVVAPDASPPRR